MTSLLLFYILDLAGTFAFAFSGAVAARNRGLDVFGIFVVAFLVACGGGVLRDVCIGAVPPAGLSDWRYLAISSVAALMAMYSRIVRERLEQPIVLFDSLGLGLFAVTGAQKAMIYGLTSEGAVILGVLTAVGGGIARDVLLNRVPAILKGQIYALAALAAALIEVFGSRLHWRSDWRAMAALATCFTLRFLAVRYNWHLPRFVKPPDEDGPDK
ncbi:trimeric intracellular cation channel family protein [Variovorax rhizosphaerae]|uniref:Trimeric intracellular cation channel family protein n=1 Tax=Variovorax rhizosphaerae TaxID=1836200 RepID=A0ABU8WNB6_9BURK